MNIDAGRYICGHKIRHEFILLLILSLVLPACAATQEKGWEGVTVTGRIVDIKGRPVMDAHTYAYLEGTSNTLGPADAMSEPTAGDGNYLMILPRGTYVLVARKRRSGSISGPMKNGDMAGQYLEPFKAVKDRSGVDIKMNIFRQGAEGDPQRILTTSTRIKGTVINNSGQNLPGFNVFAYRGLFRPDPPDYMAHATDKEGRFEISLPGGGNYTIGARTSLGGKPKPDEMIGFWGEKDKPREIEEGTVTTGVRIVVKPYREVH